MIHNSSVPLKRAVTGSVPVKTAPMRRGRGPVKSNSSTAQSGRLHTASVWPFGLIAMGCTGGVSKLTNDDPCPNTTKIDPSHNMAAAATAFPKGSFMVGDFLAWPVPACEGIVLRHMG